MSGIINTTTVETTNIETANIKHTNGTTAVTIDSNANVGVGTTSPTNFGGTNLHINHASTYASSLWTSNARSMQVLCSDANGVQSMGTRSNHPLDITTNDNAKIKITANGEVTMPSQPAFLIKASGGQQNIAINTLTEVQWNGTEVFDQNSDFTNHNFTAPVTGKYQFNAQMYLNAVDTGASYYQLQITTSNRNYPLVFTPNFSSDLTYHQVTLTMLTDMDAGDTAGIGVYQSSGTAQLDIDGGSYFSGYLVA